MRHLLVILFLNLSLGMLHSQGVQFNKAYGNDGFDYGRNIVQGADNLYYIVGSTSSSNSGNTDILVFCIDENGNEIWTHTYGSAQTDIGTDIIFSADSNLLVLGYTNGIGTGGYDVYLTKISTSGEQLMTETYGGDDWDFAYDLEVNPNGGYYIVGETYSEGSGNNDGYLLSIDEEGEVVFEETFGSSGNDLFRNMTVSSGGDLFMIGDQRLTSETTSSSWIVRANGNGEILSEHTQHVYPEYNEFGEDIEVTENYIIAASSFPDTPDGTAKTTWKGMNDSYETEWVQEDPTFMLKGFVLRSPGEVLGLGQSTSENAFNMMFNIFGGGWQSQTAIVIPLVIDIDFGLETFYDGINTNDGGYILVGQGDIDNDGQLSVLVTKFDSLLTAPETVELANLPVGIEAIEPLPILEVYPSPSKDRIWISLDNTRGGIPYRIHNSLGHLARSGNYFSEGIEIIDLPSGIYYLEVETDGKVIGRQRFIVQ